VAAGKPAKKAASLVDIAAEGERFLGALARHDGLWATSAQLGFARGEALSAALKRLRADHRIVLVGKVKNSDAYALVGNATEKECLIALADRAIRDQVRVGKLDLLPVSSEAPRYTKIPSKVRAHIKAALHECMLRGEAFPIKVGGSNCVALATNLKALLRDDAKPKARSVEAATRVRSFDTDVVVRAYEHLSAERRSPNVIVAELQRESGVELAALQGWLLAECRAHRAVPLLGEPAHATPEQLAAALRVEGRPHLYVRLVQEQS
jgi:hypothetical protein